MEKMISRFWWLSNIRYFIYFLRELSGPVIAAFSLYLLIAYFFFTPHFYEFTKTRFFSYLFFVTLVFSLIHSISWFAVMGKMMSSNVKKIPSWIFSLGLIALWLLISYFILFTGLGIYDSSNL